MATGPASLSLVLDYRIAAVCDDMDSLHLLKFGQPIEERLEVEHSTATIRETRIFTIPQNVVRHDATIN